MIRDKSTARRIERCPWARSTHSTSEQKPRPAIQRVASCLTWVLNLDTVPWQWPSEPLSLAILTTPEIQPLILTPMETQPCQPGGCQESRIFAADVVATFTHR